MRSVVTDRGTVAFYAGGMSLLTIGTGYLTWVVDIHPSLTFGNPGVTAAIASITTIPFVALLAAIVSKRR